MRYKKFPEGLDSVTPPNAKDSRACCHQTQAWNQNSDRLGGDGLGAFISVPAFAALHPATKQPARLCQCFHFRLHHRSLWHHCRQGSGTCTGGGAVPGVGDGQRAGAGWPTWAGSRSSYFVADGPGAKPDPLGTLSLISYPLWGQ